MTLPMFRQAPMVLSGTVIDLYARKVVGWVI
jgi:hypothetical protein